MTMSIWAYLKLVVALLIRFEAPITPYAYDKKTPNFAQGLNFLRSQVAIYRVVHEQFESEVEKYQIV